MAPSQFIYHQFNVSLKWFPTPEILYSSPTRSQSSELFFNVVLRDVLHGSDSS